MLKRFVWFGLLLGLLGLTGFAVFYPKIDLLGRPLRVADEPRPADIVVAVSAGKLKSCQAHPNLFLRERHAAMLVRLGYSRSGKLLISGIYSRAPQSELVTCQRHLAGFLGLVPEQLIIDNQAETTYDNARNVKRIMSENGWKDALLVTSSSHLYRAMKVFQKQQITAYPIQITDLPPYGNDWFSRNRLAHITRFLYEYGAILKYKWYGYI